MAGRIRTIKPELLEDTKTAGLDHLQFRLFISLLLLADDYGNLRASPGLIRGTAFWAVDGVTEDEIAAALAELEELSLIETYAMRGQTYAHIRGWTKHQRVDKPGKARVPSPRDPEVRPARPWVTYFIRLGKDGPIKIGRTFDVTARMRRLQTGAPEKLEVLRVLEGDFEAQLHERFQGLRTHGEWFSPGPELLTAIAEEPFANHSRTIPAPLAPDLRSPISDHDQRPTTETSPPSRAEAPPPIAPEGPISDKSPPTWWPDACDTVETSVGVQINRGAAWLRYYGHRATAGKRIAKPDAVYWLTTVDAREAAKDREERRRQSDRDAKYAARAAPPNPCEPQKLSEAEQRELAERFPMPIRRRPRGAA